MRLSLITRDNFAFRLQTTHIDYEIPLIMKNRGVKTDVRVKNGLF